MEEEDQAASGLHADNGKIDMSLDDIIKLQNEETTTHPAAIPTRPRSRASHFQSRNGFRGKQRNQQGSNRPTFGFKQGYSGTNPRNNQAGPVTRRRAATINRATLVNQQNANTKSPPNRSQTQAGRQQQQKRFRPPAVLVQGLTKRVNVQTRRTQFNSAQRGRRSNTVNQNRTLTQQVTPGKRQTNARRWQTDKGFGSTLTVSVPNRAATQGQTRGMKRPGLRFRRPAVHPKAPIPKGVPLRFNFRAMANHTNVMLNERFSSLDIRGRFSPSSRGGGRTVMLA